MQRRRATTNIISKFSAIGIDVGDKDAYYLCLDQSGEEVEEGRIALTTVGLRKTFMLSKTRIVIEAGAQSRWVSTMIEGLGHEVIVANPRQLHLITCFRQRAT